MSDDKNEDKYESNQVGSNKIKNRVSEDITGLKIVVAILAWN